jgi:hypothetical protein
VKYLGEYAIAEEDPCYRADGPGRDKELRSVIVFRLRRVDAAAAIGEPPQQPDVLVSDVGLESHITETFHVNPTRPPTNAERREADLVQRYARWLGDRGHTVGRKRIAFPRRATSLYADLFDQTAAELVEAKGSAARTDVRLALGQILDYDRYVEARSRAILLPVRPAEDLVQLLLAYNVACVYEAARGVFERVDPA